MLVDTEDLACQLFIARGGIDAKSCIKDALAFQKAWGDYATLQDRVEAAQEAFILEHPAPPPGTVERTAWEQQVYAIVGKIRDGWW